MEDIKVRVRDIYELSRAMSITMLDAEQILLNVDKNAKSHCEVI